MPMFTEEIHDHDGTVREQSIISAINNILKIIGLKDTDYSFSEPYSNSSQPEGTVGVKTPVKMGVSRRVFIDVDDIRDPDNLTDRGVGYDFQPAFFHHPVTKVQLCPAHARHDLNFSMRFRHESRAACRKFLNEIHRRASLQGDVYEISVDYHYLIPPTALSLLKATQEAHNAKLPEAEHISLLDYFVAGFSPAVTVLTNNVGGGSQYAVRNTLNRVICQMEGPGDINQEKQVETGPWEATIRFKIQVDWPEAVSVHYPAMYNNTLIGDFWWQETEVPGVSDDVALRNVYVTAQDKISQRRPTLNLPIFMPPVDAPEVKAGTRDPGEFSMIIGYLEMDGDRPSPVHLFSLANLGEVSFAPKHLEYLKAAYAENQDGRDSIYRVYVYDNYNQFDPQYVGVTPDLDAYLIREVFLEKTYRFAISVRTDWRYLTDKGKEILGKFPDVIKDVIVEFRPDLIPKYPELFVPRIDWPGSEGFPWPTQPGDGAGAGVDWDDLEPDDIDRIIDDLTSPGEGDDGKNYYRSMFTVLNGRIIARRT